MSEKFIIIKLTDENKPKESNQIYRLEKVKEIWKRQFFDTVMKYTGECDTLYDLPQDKLAKVGLVGIKYFCSRLDVSKEKKRLGIDEPKTLEDNQYHFQLIDSIFSVLGCLTLRNFVNTFPVDKTYDGKKWDCKDYFYTMEVLSKMNWDKPIGRDKFFEFLWDYENKDLRNVCIDYMCSMSAVYRSQTGKGIAEQWCDNMGIPTYMMDRETGIVKDNKTGNTSKPKKTSHIKIVK